MKCRATTYFCIAIFAIISFSACDRPACKNSNPIFDQFDFRSSEYQVELQTQLSSRKQSDVRYWLADFTEDGDSAYLIVHIQSNKLCAKGLVKINDWQKLAGIRRTKGKGYFGAELRGLTLGISNDPKNPGLVYQGLSKIID